MPFSVPESFQPIVPQRAAGPPPLPAPGFFETLGAAVRTTQDESSDSVALHRSAGYDALAEALGELGVPRAALVKDRLRFMGLPMPGSDGLDYGKVWRAVAAKRAGDAKLFRDIAATREEYEQGLIRRDGGRDSDQQVLGRATGVGGTVAAFAGASLADMADSDLGPVQFMAGGGTTVLRSMLVNGAIGVTEEAVKTPERLRNRKALGEPMSGAEVGINLLGAFAAPAVLTGAGHGLAKGIDLGQSGFEKVVAANWERLPEALRTRWAARATVEDQPLDDGLLADMAEAVIGRERMSEAEAGAVTMLRREAGIAAANPFRPDGAGLAAHDEALGAAMRRIMASPGEPFVAPSTGSGRAGPMGSTAISTRTVSGDAIDGYMRLNRRQESAGDDLAVPRDRKTGRLLSSAYGRYQFIGDTWVSYYTRRFGTGGLSRDQILSKRANGSLQDVLMRDLTEDNAAFLRAQGQAVTPGNLYLVHFAGQGGAKRLFEGRMLGADAVKANPFLQGMTPDDVLDWAHRKMGGQGGAPRSGGPTLRADVEMAAAERRSLQDELDAAHAALAEVAGESSAAVRRALDDGAALVPVDALRQAQGDRGMVDAPALEPRAGDADAPPAEVLAILPGLRAVVADKGRSLNQIGGLAKELGASEAELRRGLAALANGGELRQRKDGSFQRPAPRGVRRAYDSDELLNFIAKSGGLRNDEGHGLGLTGVSARERREMVPAAIADAKRKRAGGGRNWRRMTPAGPLLRHEGLSIDAMGARLQEHGFFPIGGPRPTEREVLDLIDARISGGKKAYPLGHDKADQPGAGEDMADPTDADQLEWVAGQISEIKETLGLTGDDVDAALLDRAARFALDNPELSRTEALIAAINDDFHDVRLQSLDQSGDLRYEDIEDDWPFDPLDPATGGQDRADGGSGGGRAVAAGDAGAGQGQSGAADGAGQAGAAGKAGAAGHAGPALADLPYAEVTRFLDPDGPEAKAQGASLEHDARSLVFARDERANVDPAIAARQAQEVQLGAEAPLRARADQDGTMGSPLFDAVDAPTFRLDAEGAEKPLQSLLNEFDAEAAEIKNTRDCL